MSTETQKEQEEIIDTPQEWPEVVPKKKKPTVFDIWPEAEAYIASMEAASERARKDNIRYGDPEEGYRHC